MDLLVATFHAAFFKWVDDIISTRTPLRTAAGGQYVYNFDIQDVVGVLEFLGFKIAHPKVTAFAYMCTYNGFAWDVANKKVSLPDTKRAKYLHCVQAALSPAARLSLKEAEKLRGCLVHTCFVFLSGRLHLPSLHRFVSSFRKNRFSRRFLSPMMLSDLQWWHTALSDPSYSRSLLVRPVIDHDIWVNASTSWGVALVVGTRFQAWQLAPGWDAAGQHIGWAECIGLEVAMIFAVQQGWQEARLLVHSDNSGAIGQFLKGQSRNIDINASIIRTEELCRAANLSITPIYVQLEDNRADAASRGMPQPNLIPLAPPVLLPGAIQPHFLNG